MPWCDTDAMAAHLIEISAAVDPGAHAVLIVDQAGWHLTPKLAIPDNITVLALPPRSPELNPVENVWQFMRDNWLSNRIFKSYEDIALKNRILLENYYLPGDLEAQLDPFVEHYTHRRYHESLNNLTPANVYFGRGQTILLERERIKRKTIEHRRLQHRERRCLKLLTR